MNAPRRIIEVGGYQPETHVAAELRSTATIGSVLDAWVDPATRGATSANETLAVAGGQGHLQLAVEVTAVGAGFHRYEYALLNHDFDRQVGELSIPVDPVKHELHVLGRRLAEELRVGAPDGRTAFVLAPFSGERLPEGAES